MKKVYYIKQVILFLVIFLLAFLYEQNNTCIENGVIQRNEAMEGTKEVELILNAEGLPEDYVYKLQVEEVLYSESEAHEWFEIAKAEINHDFEEISIVVPAKEQYASGRIEAEWSFSPANCIHADYSVNQEKVPKEGIVVNAIATLRCGEYEELYTFAFVVKKRVLTQEEEMTAFIDAWFEQEMQKEGISEIVLPEEINGIRLNWSQKSSNIAFKVLGLEIIVALLLYLREKEQKKEKEKSEQNSMEQDYPEIIGSLSVLMGAGMTLKQAWNVMANQYTRRIETDGYQSKAAYKEIILVNRKIQEGESEKEALLEMMERIPLMCYHRLIRMLLANREKGTKGLCEMLDKEAEAAYEQRILNVRKSGEEASTKLLMPMMIMLFLVMAIVLLPAFINFSI